jgi:hypothetical protein
MQTFKFQETASLQAKDFFFHKSALIRKNKCLLRHDVMFMNVMFIVKALKTFNDA